MKPLNINADQEFLFYGKGYVNGHYNNWWDKANRNKLIPLKKNQFINSSYLILIKNSLIIQNVILVRKIN